MYNQSEDKWTEFNEDNSNLKKGFTHIYIGEDSSIYVSSDNIYKFNPTLLDFEIVEDDLKCDKFVYDKNGDLYFIKQIFVYKKVNNSIVEVFNGQENGPRYPTELLIDNNNVLWFGTDGFSPGIYSYENNQLKTYNSNDFNSHEFSTVNITLDSNNNVWFVSDQDAITFQYLSETGKWKKFDSTNSPFGQDFLYSKGIETSKDNKVWLVPGKLFSLAPRFLTYHKNEEWKKYSIDDALDLGPKDELYLLALAIDSKNNVWIGTDKGLIKFNEAQTSVATFEQSNIKLYPNPTSEFMKIDLQENLITSYSILDLNGKIVKQQHHNFQNQITIDTKQLIAGSYFIKLKLSDNTYVQSKFVKE